LIENLEGFASNFQVIDLQHDGQDLK